MSNDWIKLRGEKGEEWVRCSTIDRMRPNYLSHTTELFTWQGHHIATVKDSPSAILDAMYQQEQSNSIGFVI